MANAALLLLDNSSIGAPACTSEWHSQKVHLQGGNQKKKTKQIEERSTHKSKASKKAKHLSILEDQLSADDGQTLLLKGYIEAWRKKIGLEQSCNKSIVI